jgi:hypothetical protein
LALYGHCVSYAQLRQRVASPASAGLPALRKWCSEPKEDTRAGASAANQWQSRSTSWQDLVMSANEARSSRAQLPRTYECAKCQWPIGSTCTALTSVPSWPERMISVIALV